MALLEIDDLTVEFPSAAGRLRAVDGVSLNVEQGEVLGIVGESGSGKSVTMLALMGLVPFPGEVSAGRLAFDGHDLLVAVGGRAPQPHRQGRGDDLPGADDQPQSVLHRRLPDRGDAAPASRRWIASRRTRRAIELLEQVGIPAPESRLSRLSAPALRRHEPARHDRHGDRLQSEAADRRRADHRARRDHPGADPRSAAVAAARARHGADSRSRTTWAWSPRSRSASP